MKTRGAAFYMFILHSSLVFTRGSYIVRQIGYELRHCIRYHDCPPGHEIHVCKEDYTKDTCESCMNKTYIQPEYISSTENVKLQRCFIPQSKCSAHDVIPSRSKTTKECHFASFCKCNRGKCYYGNPCECIRRPTPCKAGETMNDQGECVKCPIGTVKHKVGCGPCKYDTQSTSGDRTTAANDDTTDNMKTLVPKKSKSEKTYTMESVTQLNMKSVTQPGYITYHNRSDSELSIAIIIMLAVLAVILCIILIVCLLKYKRHHEDLINPERGPLMDNPPAVVDHTDVPFVQQVGNPEPKIVTKNNIKNNLKNGEVKSTNARLDSDIAIQDVRNKSSSFTSENEFSTGQTLPELISKIVNEKEKDLFSTVEFDSNQEESRNFSNDVENMKDPVKKSSDVNNIVSIAKQNEGGHQAEQAVYHVIHNPIDNRNRNADNLNISNIPGHTQITENQFCPITQPSDTGEVESFRHDKGPPSSGYGTQGESIPSNSPMSMIVNPRTGQEYNHLVSVSERTTESIRSNLEYYNHTLVGENVQNSHTENTDFNISSPDGEKDSKHEQS